MASILIVDDDQKWRDLFSSMIALMGFDVAVAESGDEALKQFLKRPFDLVVIDLNMPRMDGLSLARHVKDISPETKVVLVTAGDRELTLKKIEESSADLALFKLFGLKELQETVQKMLDSP